MSFEINEEVIVDGNDCGFISFIDDNDYESYYVVESEMTGTTYYIYNESRLVSAHV
jgi:hypothetical protein